MPNYFRERLAPLIYSSDLRTKFRLIRWMQRKRLLKRNVNCTGCGNRMKLNACRRKRDGYQWYVPGFCEDQVTSGGGGTRYIFGWGGAVRPLIP